MGLDLESMPQAMTSEKLSLFYFIIKKYRDMPSASIYFSYVIHIEL
jgi:hypothetical protein